jgi:hypothetical protein
MKILAVVSLKQGFPLEQVRPELQAELQGSWRLYVNGVLREAYLTESATASSSCWRHPTWRPLRSSCKTFLW